MMSKDSEFSPELPVVALQAAPSSTDDLSRNLAWVAQALTLLHRNGFLETIRVIERALRWHQSDKLDAANIVLRNCRHIAHPSLVALRVSAEQEAARRGVPPAGPTA